MSRFEFLKLASILAILTGVLAVPGTALATDPIVLDGNFDDWAGEMNVDDTIGDAPTHHDITRFWWADNDD